MPYTYLRYTSGCVASYLASLHSEIHACGGALYFVALYYEIYTRVGEPIFLKKLAGVFRFPAPGARPPG